MEIKAVVQDVEWGKPPAAILPTVSDDLTGVDARRILLPHGYITQCTSRPDLKDKAIVVYKPTHKTWEEVEDLLGHVYKGAEFFFIGNSTKEDHRWFVKDDAPPRERPTKRGRRAN